LHKLLHILFDIPRNGAKRLQETKGVDAKMTDEFYKEGALSFCLGCAGKHFTLTGRLVFEGDCGCVCHKG
jgi:hypothetical protein